MVLNADMLEAARVMKAPITVYNDNVATIVKPDHTMMYRYNVIEVDSELINEETCMFIQVKKKIKANGLVEIIYDYDTDKYFVNGEKSNDILMWFNKPYFKKDFDIDNLKAFVINNKNAKKMLYFLKDATSEVSININEEECFINLWYSWIWSSWERHRGNASINIPITQIGEESKWVWVADKIRRDDLIAAIKILGNNGHDIYITWYSHIIKMWGAYGEIFIAMKEE